MSYVTHYHVFTIYLYIFFAVAMNCVYAAVEDEMGKDVAFFTFLLGSTQFH